MVLRGQAGGRLPPPRSHNPSIEDAGIFHEYATNTALEYAYSLNAEYSFVFGLYVCVCVVYLSTYSVHVYSELYSYAFIVYSNVYSPNTVMGVVALESERFRLCLRRIHDVFIQKCVYS